MNPDTNLQQLDIRIIPYSLAFSGKITASVTHELNNLLGTVDQVNGLIEDMAEFAEPDQAAQSEKLRSVSDKIVRQVERGSQLIDRLNAFAHMSDNWYGECDINEIVENITELSQRLARLNKVSMNAILPADSITINTCPFLAAQLHFTIIMSLITSAAKGSSVQIELDRTDSGVSIDYSVQCEEQTLQISENDEISLLTEILRVHLDETHQDGMRRIEILYE